jgi:hypothetical protein
MANLDFYATVKDHEVVLGDLFREGDVRIFESYSALDRDLREFTRPAEIIDELQKAERTRHAVLLQLWAPATSAKLEIQRFSVSVEGHTHRHRIAGWGLMQLYLSKETHTEIPPSHFGHFGKKAAAKQSADPLSPPPNPGTEVDWDWELLQRISRRIQYRIRGRFSAMKIGSRPVLHNAVDMMRDSRLLAVN